MLTLDHVVFPVRDAEATLKSASAARSVAHPEAADTVRRWARGPNLTATAGRAKGRA